MHSAAGSTRQEIVNLVVCGLREILVPEPHRLERPRRLGADDFVYFAAKIIARLRRGNRDGHDQLLGAKLSNGARGCQQRRARGQPIVYEDDYLAFNLDRTSSLAISSFTAFEFLLFAF